MAVSVLWRGRAVTGPLASTGDANRIAVLYIEAPADPPLAATARGLTRDLIYTLERVPDLRLISEDGIRSLGPHPALDSVARKLDVVRKLID